MHLFVVLFCFVVCKINTTESGKLNYQEILTNSNMVLLLSNEHSIICVIRFPNLLSTLYKILYGRIREQE